MTTVRRGVIVERIWPDGIPTWSCAATASNERDERVIPEGPTRGLRGWVSEGGLVMKE